MTDSVLVRSLRRAATITGWAELHVAPAAVRPRAQSPTPHAVLNGLVLDSGWVHEAEGIATALPFSGGSSVVGRDGQVDEGTVRLLFGGNVELLGLRVRDRSMNWIEGLVRHRRAEIIRGDELLAWAVAMGISPSFISGAKQVREADGERRP